MDMKHNIRSMSVIAHVDHGKTTLTDSLVQKAGIISSKAAGGARYTDTRPDEAERGITIKSTGISMFFEYDLKAGEAAGLSEEEQAENDAAMADKQDADKNVKITENSYLINLIDSPGHVDFSTEVTAALRVTDGALVVVDYIEGTAVQTETVLRQALGEKVIPVLIINKIDRGILEQQVDGETMYQKFLRVIENVNVLIATYEDQDNTHEELKDMQIDPIKGTCAFGSALFGWAFTITKFAKVYAAKFGIEKSKMMEKLWGDNFFDQKAKKWKNHDKSDDDKILKRAFVQFMMEPVIRLCKATMHGEMEKVDKMLISLDITLKKDERML